MIIIKIKRTFLAAAILILSVFAASCSGGKADVPPNEKIFFSDKNGAEFSVQITPCTDKNNGKINLNIEGEKNYLYSTDFGRTFNKVRRSEISLNKISEGSYSFCLMERDVPDDLRTDIYTVYADSILQPYHILITAISASEKIYGDGKITVRVENFDAAAEYEVTLNNWETSKSFSGETVDFDLLEQGIYSVSVKNKKSGEASPVLSVPIVHSDVGAVAYIEVKAVLQTPELPTGCEITSLAMLLNYIGFNADKLTLADEYLPKGEYRKTDFNKVFVGDPRSSRAYGCTAGVIAETAGKFLNDYDKSGKWQVKNITGCSCETLYSAVKLGYPAVVWGSIDMAEFIEDYVVWTDEETGNTVSWFGMEHCLLLTGYDKKAGVVYVNDPLRGSTSYDMKTFEKRFEEFGSNAVIITEIK